MHKDQTLQAKSPTPAKILLHDDASHPNGCYREIWGVTGVIVLKIVRRMYCQAQHMSPSVAFVEGYCSSALKL